MDTRQSFNEDIPTFLHLQMLDIPWSLKENYVYFNWEVTTYFYLKLDFFLFLDFNFLCIFFNTPAPDEERFQSCFISSIEGIMKNLRRKLVLLNMEGKIFHIFPFSWKGLWKLNFYCIFLPVGQNYSYNYIYIYIYIYRAIISRKPKKRKEAPQVCNCLSALSQL